MISLPIFNSNDVYNLSPSKIVALGLNYLDHIKESASIDVFKEEIPKEPVLFPKTTNVLIANNENIVIPKLLTEYNFDNERTDYEAELAFIIKERCKNIKESDAMNYILGFTCFNDVSQRNIQRGDKSGWYRGKSFDTFGPIGPQLVLTKDIKDPQNLNIKCRLNGKTVQNSNTKHMIFKPPAILAYVSKNFTLEAGDIITTGTPSGVGPVKEGDIVEVEIEKIGILQNRVIQEV